MMRATESIKKWGISIQQPFFNNGNVLLKVIEKCSNLYANKSFICLRSRTFKIQFITVILLKFSC